VPVFFSSKITSFIAPHCRVSKLIVREISTIPLSYALKIIDMNQHYYHQDDLKKFGNVAEFQKEMAEKFFAYYGEVFKEGELTAREKSLIALAVSHAVQCPYCIDSYSNDAYEKGWSESQMMEAVHVACAIRGGASLVHGVQMMNKVREIAM
jgi:alkylhydroperoxidase/carboxymuconolactone decarboxylase family protein